jgi:serralysin
MANYFFETMSDSDAAAFTSDDRLFFLSGTPSSVTVTHQEATTGGLHPTAESTTITLGAVSHTFQADELAGASAAHDIIFVSGGNDTLVVDSDAGSTIDLGAGNSAGPYDPATYDVDLNAHTILYAFGGADTITGGNASDWIDGGNGSDTITGVNDGSADALAHKADVLQGGGGGDTITGADGNDHIYGNTLATAAGTTDGGDLLSGGNGNDYINGNAGNDTIDGGLGNDRLYGGNNDDVVTGGAGYDYLQGNKGNDTLDGGADNDTIHGGADNDSLVGGTGNDQLFGDNGNDTLSGGAGYDSLTGGAGNDTFSFGATDASVANLNTVATATDHGLTDVITDFTHGADKLGLAGGAPTAIDLQGSGVTFSGVDDAYAYAKTLIAAHVADVAAIQVGSDTYLFYDTDHTGGTIDAVVKLSSFTASTLTTSDFV